MATCSGVKNNEGSVIFAVWFQQQVLIAIDKQHSFIPNHERMGNYVTIGLLFDVTLSKLHESYIFRIHFSVLSMFFRCSIVVASFISL